MSQTESTVSPLSLKQLPPPPDDPLLQLFYNLLTWFRGDMKIGLGTLSVAASIGAPFNIEPPDQSEEWEIAYVHVVDYAKIDINDNVSFSYGDVVILKDLLLQFNEKLSSASTVYLDGNTGFSCTFPDRNTTAANAAITSIQTSVTDMGWLTRRKDNGSPWLRFIVRYTATATVGTRTVKIIYVYRRRRLI